VRSGVAAVALVMAPPSVAVFENGRAVKDLPVDGFALFDNGEMQDVAIMSVGSVPIDVTLAPGRPHFVVALGDGDNASWLGAEDVSTARGRGSLPYQSPPSSDGLEDAARLTGGGYHRVRADDPLTEVFSQINDFKSTYLLWFEPGRKPAPGWHELAVHVRGGGEYDVRARRGYYGG